MIETLPTDGSAVAEALNRLVTLLEGSVVVPEALGPDGAARLCGVSRSAWHDLVRRGLTPAPVEIGTGTIRKFLRRELIAWLAAGAPARSRWQSMRASAMRSAG